MAQTEVIVTIDPENFTIAYEVSGIPGTKCKNITDILMKGKKVLKEQDTAEIREGGYNEYVAVGD